MWALVQLFFRTCPLIELLNLRYKSDEVSIPTHLVVDAGNQRNPDALCSSTVTHQPHRCCVKGDTGVEARKGRVARAKHVSHHTTAIQHHFSRLLLHPLLKIAYNPPRPIGEGKNLYRCWVLALSLYIPSNE